MLDVISGLRQTVATRVTLSVFLLSAAGAILATGCAAVKRALDISNAPFRLEDTTGVLSEIRSVGIVDGETTVFEEGRTEYEPRVLVSSDKLRMRLVRKLTELNVSALRIVSDTIPLVENGHAPIAAHLRDPFAIEAEGSGMMMSVENRSWSECNNCTQLADSLGVDAIWVIWGRWYKDVPVELQRPGRLAEQPFRQELSEAFYQYSDDEKGWLHASANLFSAKDGHLLAWTAINRTGVGVGPLVKYSKVYDYVAGGMAENFAKQRAR